MVVVPIELEEGETRWLEMVATNSLVWPHVCIRRIACRCSQVLYLLGSNPIILRMLKKPGDFQAIIIAMIVAAVFIGTIAIVGRIIAFKMMTKPKVERNG